MHHFIILALSFTLLSPSLALAKATQVESASLSTAQTKITEECVRVGKKNVLMVFDADNTLLASNQDLGGDTWWNIQDELLKKKLAGTLTPVEARDLAGATLDDLFEIAGLLFHLGHMHTPQTDTAAIVKGIQDAGVATIVLTSRGPQFSNLTFREMARNGLDFKKSALGPEGGYPSTYLPYDMKELDAADLTAKDLTSWGLKEARPVKFEDGIYFTSGQHKGAMLRALIAKTKQPFKAIVFIDDGKKNTDRMVQGYEKVDGVDVLAIRYSKMDPIVERIRKESKNKMRVQLVRIKKVIEELFPLKPHIEN